MMNNKSFAQAFVAATANKGMTISSLIKVLPKAAYKVDLRKKVNLAKAPRAAAAPADAMASVVAEATKAAKGKPENYSAELTETVLTLWAESKKDKAAVESIAALVGKTARSLVAKLSREKVYVKQTYVTKAGVAPVSKEQHVATIAAFIGKRPDELESLEKATKNVLVLLEDHLKKSAHEHDNATSDNAETKATKDIMFTEIAEIIGGDASELASLKTVKKETLQAILAHLQTAE